jgi:hypothetical protein
VLQVAAPEPAQLLLSVQQPEVRLPVVLALPGAYLSHIRTTAAKYRAKSRMHGAESIQNVS